MTKMYWEKDDLQPLTERVSALESILDALMCRLEELEHYIVDADGKGD